MTRVIVRETMALLHVVLNFGPSEFVANSIFVLMLLLIACTKFSDFSDQSHYR